MIYRLAIVAGSVLTAVAFFALGYWMIGEISH
jgi:hypothetical protein